MTFFGLKQGQDLDNRAAHPHQEFSGVPPPWAFGQIAPYETSDQAKKNNFMVVGVQETDQTRG